MAEDPTHNGKGFDPTEPWRGAATCIASKSVAFTPTCSP